MQATDEVVRSFGVARMFKVRCWFILKRCVGVPVQAPALTRLHWKHLNWNKAPLNINAVRNSYGLQRLPVWLAQLGHKLPAGTPSAPWFTSLLPHTQESRARINAIDFHRRADLMVTSADDDAIRTYNVHSGVLEHTLFSRKYGAAHVCFTHHEGAVIYASSKVRACW